MTGKDSLPEETIDILIAEDSPTQAEQLRHLLERHRYRITAAKNGTEALDQIRRHIPSLVISDIVMPGMGGYELCRNIKALERTQEIPVILLTSLTDPEDVLTGLDCGADSYLIKPYDENYLLTVISLIISNTAVRGRQRRLISVEAFFLGERRVITANPDQMLNLLLSSFEAAVIRNSELLKAQNDLKSLNDRLEDLVSERTASLSTEIAERKQAQEALQESEERYRRITEGLSDYLYTVYVRNGRVVETIHNQACAAVTGYSQEDFRRDDLLWIDIVPEEERQSVIEHGRNAPIGQKYADHRASHPAERRGNPLGQRHSHTETRLQRRPRILRWGHQRYNRSQDGGGRASGARLSAETANRTKSDFLANMSHELRTPLNSIIGFTEVLQDSLYGDLNEKQREYLGYINTSGRHLLDLINDILDLSKVESGKTEVILSSFSVHTLLDLSLIMFRERATKHSMALEFSIAPEADIEMVSDEHKIKQIVFNLLSNAVKFTPDGGRVRVDARKTGKASSRYRYPIRESG